jgi:hypothetical protein
MAYDPINYYRPIRYCHPDCHCYECCKYSRQERMLSADEITYLIRREVEKGIYQISREMQYIARPQQNYLPEPGKKMRLTTLAKKLFDSDTRAFIKAGILDESLEITTQGTKFLLAQYLTNNKKELAKEARKKIREDKEKDQEDSEE